MARKVKAKAPPMVPPPPPIVNAMPPATVDDNAQRATHEAPLPFFTMYIDPPLNSKDTTPIRVDYSEYEICDMLRINEFNDAIEEIAHNTYISGFDKAAATYQIVANWVSTNIDRKDIFLLCFGENNSFEDITEIIASILPYPPSDASSASKADATTQTSIQDVPKPIPAPPTPVAPPRISNLASLRKEGQKPPKTVSQSPPNPSPPKKTNNQSTSSNWAANPPSSPSTEEADTPIQTSTPDAPISISAPPSSVAPLHTPTPVSLHKDGQLSPKADPQPPLKVKLLPPKKASNPKKSVKSPSPPSTAENTFPVPITSKRPPPKSAPPVSTSASPRPNRHNEAKHTSHGPSRRGIYLTPPAQSSISAGSFTLETINSLNSLIIRDLHIEDFTITAAHQTSSGIHLDTTRPPTPPITAFILKHVRRIFPTTPDDPINVVTPTSCSYLKVQDVPIIHDSTKIWVKPTSEAFLNALKLSPVGSLLFNHIKHKPRIMHVSPHSDSCIAWIDIHDTTSGKTAASLIGKFIPINGFNCRILGAKPHSGSTFCSRCQKWGHHFSQCRSQATRCSLCGGYHHTSNHDSVVKPERRLHLHCINCSASKQGKTNHASTDHKCPFWQHRFDRKWLKRQFKKRD